MNCDQASERIAERWRGELETSEETALREHLRGCPSCARDAEELDTLWREMVLPEESPSPALRARFYAMLEHERRRQDAVEDRPRLGARLAPAFAALWPRRPLLQAVLVAAGLVAGVLLGRSTAPRSSEIGDLRQEVQSLSHLVALSMLQQDSASSRLQGVSYGRAAGASDERVLRALLEAATRDPNVNVRLAAIDALSPALGRPALRDKLVASFAEQPSPLLQIALVDAVADADGAEARHALRPLLDLHLDPAVKGHLEKVVGTPS